MKTKFWLSFLTITIVVVDPKNAIWQANAVAIAQTYQPSNRTPVADNTLGTQVSGSGNNFNITGGLNKGQTLFHSFTDFSVPTNGQANFTNPVGNRDIITRVTGTVFSDINGLVNTNGSNFFLINPNGIVFGTNAQLNVGKAFVGSTANGVDLVDGSGRTITFGTNANGDAPLLSIAPNVLFDVSRLNMGGGTGAISNFGTLQTPNNSQYIGLIGGNVTLDGGKIIAPGGRVDIGGLSGAGSVSVDNNGLVFSSSGVGRSNVVLTNDAGIIVRDTGTLDTVNTFFNNATSNGSSINISANNLDLLNSGVKLNDRPAALDAGLEINSGLQTKAAGDINIDATGNVSLNNANIKNTLRSGAEGNIGGIKIQAGTLDLKNNSLVSTATTGKGNAGNIDLKTSGGINLINKSVITSDNSEQTAQGNAGDINITANGDIKVSGYDVLSTNPTSSYINSSTSGQGDAGKITIDTQGKLSVVNNGDISSNISKTAVGNGQGIKISARELEIANQSYISTSTFQNTQVNGKGNAGDIDIKTTGDIRVSGFDSPSTTPTLSYISSDTQGYGDTGKVTIDTQGKLSVVNFGNISSSIAQSAVGNSKGVKIKARELKLADRNSSIVTSSALNSQGNAGDITIETIGDIQLFGYDASSTNPSTSDFTFISSNTVGQGNAGKITIDTQGKLYLINNSAILSAIDRTAVGNSQGISINARELEIANASTIATETFQSAQVDGKGNAGDINIKTTGDIKISGYDSSVTNPTASDLSQISSSTQGQGNTGKTTIDAQGKLSIVNQGSINSRIYKTAVGNSKGISITARELELANVAAISTRTEQPSRVDGKGNAGDISIKTTGDVNISGSTNFDVSKASLIESNSFGQGDTGKITIDTQGKLLLVNRGIIFSALAFSAVGNSLGVKINARELELANGSFIATNTLSTVKGNAGDIEVKTSGDIKLAGVDAGSSFSSNTFGQGDAGKITIDTQGKLSLFDRSLIVSNVGKSANGNGRDISISAREIELNQSSFIGTGTDQIAQVNGNGKSGDINLKVEDKISFKNISGIFTRSTGAGQTGNVSITAAQLLLNDSGFLSDSTSVSSGGNVTISLSDKLLLRNVSFIATNSGSSEKNGNGGNITISSPLIIALPGDNDITANAYQGTGGKVNITSQGLFGIQYRPIGSEFTSDITASSEFGQSGTVNVDTPGTDPGRDSTELPNTATDASNQISQVCSANTSQNKLTVTGRGGLPAYANDLLTSDVVWQDARATSSQPATSSISTPTKLAPPAVGWVFDGKGKVTLIAAGTQGQPTGTQVVCPNVK